MSKAANRLTAKRIERLKKPGRYHDGYGSSCRSPRAARGRGCYAISATGASACWASVRSTRSL